MREIDAVVKELSEMKDVLTIILYGSFARGEFTSRSDIDLFIIVEEERAKEEVEDRILRIESEHAIQPLIRAKKELKITDPGLFTNVFKEGKILFLREPLDLDVSLLLDLKPVKIVTFNLKNLEQKDKAKFNSALYGVRKGRYVYKGLLERFGGRKLANGCILVPEGKWGDLEKLFKSYGINFEVMDTWK